MVVRRRRLNVRAEHVAGAVGKPGDGLRTLGLRSSGVGRYLARFTPLPDVGGLGGGGDVAVGPIGINLATDGYGPMVDLLTLKFFRHKEGTEPYSRGQ